MSFIESLESRLLFNAGALDTTYGDNGLARVDFTAPLGAGWQIRRTSFAQDSGGRMYLLGDMEADAQHGGGRVMVISRLTRDGDLDASFNGGGYKILDTYIPPDDPTPTYHLHEFVDQNNRAYVIDGPLLWRLTPGGRVDPSFGRKGKILIPILAGSSAQESAQGMAFDGNGRAYLAGNTKGKTGTRMTVIRLNEDGSFDPTWAYQGAYKSPVRGTAVTDRSSSSAELLRFLPNGQLMVAGAFTFHDPAPPEDLLPQGYTTHGTWTTRLNSGGEVDGTYGVDGYAESTAQDADVTISSTRPLAIAPDGAVIGVLHVNTDAEGDDASLGSNFRIPADGKNVDDPFVIAPPSFDTPTDDIEEIDDPIAVQPDGKILAQGPMSDVFRSTGDGSGALDTSWGTNGIAGFVVDAAAGTIQIQPDGSVLVVSGIQPGIFGVRRLYPNEAPLAQYDGRNIRTARTTALRFVVTYRDDDGINLNSLDSRDIAVFGPFDGAAPRNKFAAFEPVQTLTDGRRVATYHIASPGGWTRADNGLYSVNLLADQVEDANGIKAAASTLGTFRVRIA